MTAFLALLRRDLVVASRNAPLLLLSTLTQPVLVVLVFGNILPRLGLVARPVRDRDGARADVDHDADGGRAGRADPARRWTSRAAARWTSGCSRRSACSASRSSTSSPERSTPPPRACSPLPAMMLLMHGTGLATCSPRWSLLLPLVAVSGLLSAAFGLTLGTRVQPRFAGLLFAVVLGPMMLFGCAYYPWAELTAIGAFQYLFLLNPLVFMSEAMRLAVTPEGPHMPLPLLAAGLFGWLAAFTAIGARAFEKRAIL